MRGDVAAAATQLHTVAFGFSWMDLGWKLSHEADRLWNIELQWKFKTFCCHRSLLVV